MALARPSSPSSARAPPFSLLEFGNLVSAALDSPDPLLLSPFLSAPAHRSIDSNAHDEQKQMASHRISTSSLPTPMGSTGSPV
ncbi:hypothetical protein C8R47DRAFT_1221156 [Mycena vitilis]|nr:hypothetical protein C8R47DRAFT_1221156 [Mycena vitilis]